MMQKILILSLALFSCQITLTITDNAPGSALAGIVPAAVIDLICDAPTKEDATIFSQRSLMKYGAATAIILSIHGPHLHIWPEMLIALVGAGLETAFTAQIAKRTEKRVREEAKDSLVLLALKGDQEITAQVEKFLAE